MPGTLQAKNGVDHFNASRDLRHVIYRGESIKLKTKNYYLSSDRKTFTHNLIPLEKPYQGFRRSGLKGYYAVPQSISTARKHIDYKVTVGRVKFDHGQSKAVFLVNIFNDYISEGEERLQLCLFDARYENGLMIENGYLILKRGEYEWKNVFLTSEVPTASSSLSSSTNSKNSTISNNSFSTNSTNSFNNATTNTSSASGNQQNGKWELILSFLNKNFTEEIIRGDTLKFGEDIYHVKRVNYTSIVLDGRKDRDILKDTNCAIYKLHPSIGQRRTLDLSVTNDSPLLSSDFLPGEIVFQDNQTSTVHTTHDLTVYMKGGDYIVYENDANEKAASMVDNVTVNSFQIMSSSSQNILKNGVRRKAYLGTTPDAVGKLYFDVKIYKTLESKMLHENRPRKQLTGYFVKSDIDAKELITNEDRRETLTNGTALFIDNIKYIVQSISYSKITLNTDFQGLAGIKYNGYIDAFRKISKIEGLSTLYRG